MVTLQAQENRELYSRSIAKLGGAFTVGGTFTIDKLGYGLMTMTYRFFDPFVPGGCYYGFGGTDIRHTVGAVLIGDVRPVTNSYEQRHFHTEREGFPFVDDSLPHEDGPAQAAESCHRGSIRRNN